MNKKYATSSLQELIDLSKGATPAQAHDIINSVWEIFYHLSHADGLSGATRRSAELAYRNALHARQFAYNDLMDEGRE